MLQLHSISLRQLSNSHKLHKSQLRDKEEAYGKTKTERSVSGAAT